MILLTNGCSFTAADTFEDTAPNLSKEEHEANTWSSVLGSLLKASKVVNLGYGCGSNSRILRTTFDWINEQNRQTLKNTVAVIQWTEPSRYEYYVPENSQDNVFENKPDRWAQVKTGVLLSPEKNYRKAFKKSQARFYHYTDIEGLYKHIFECLALKQLFRIHKIPYFFWEMDSRISEYPQEFNDFVTNNFVFLDIERWDYDTVSENDSHPSLLGHRQIAEIIFDRIKDKI